MANEETQLEMGMDGMPELLSALLGEWEEAAPEAVDLLPLESLSSEFATETDSVLEVEEPLDALDKDKEEIVVEPAPEPASLLNIEALLEAWDNDRQELVARPKPGLELVKLARAIEDDLRPAKENRATDAEAKYRYITFWMADEAYALPIAQVIESDKLAEVTPLPQVNEAIRGLIHLRGEILPMLNLRLILGSKSTEVDERMLIVKTKNSSGACGVAVDRVSGLIAIRPHELAQCESKYVSSYCERQGSQIGLLDLDRIFEDLSNPLALRECNV